MFKIIRKIISKWCTLVLLSCLVPKKRRLVLFVGADHATKAEREFCGNVKYLYLYLNRIKSDIQYYFFTEHKSTYKILAQNKLPVVYHPTLLSIYLLLRANILIVGCTEWRKKSKYYLSFRAKKIQLWHGVGFKKVELAISSIANFNNLLRGRLDSAVRGKFIKHDLVISPSEFFTENVFSKAFRAKHFLESGYPKNDIFFNDQNDEHLLLGSDEAAISRISELRANGYKIILYAPTFRDTGEDAITDGVLNLGRLSRFAEKYRAVFVFKFHVIADDTYKTGVYSNILKYDKSGDIQPLMRLSDILITDYSSVCIDYLLFNRPVIFFPYDYEKYSQKVRELLFDYDWITPGPKCYSQGELETTITNILSKNKDDYSHERERVRDIAFKYKDGKASERIWSFIKANYL